MCEAGKARGFSHIVGIERFFRGHHKIQLHVQTQHIVIKFLSPFDDLVRGFRVAISFKRNTDLLNRNHKTTCIHFIDATLTVCQQKHNRQFIVTTNGARLIPALIVHSTNINAKSQPQLLKGCHHFHHLGPFNRTNRLNHADCFGYFIVLKPCQAFFRESRRRNNGFFFIFLCWFKLFSRLGGRVEIKRFLSRFMRVFGRLFLSRCFRSSR